MCIRDRLSYEQEFGDDTAIKLTYFKNKKTDAIAMDYSLAPNYQYMNIEKSSSELSLIHI